MWNRKFEVVRTLIVKGQVQHLVIEQFSQSSSASGFLLVTEWFSVKCSASLYKRLSQISFMSIYRMVFAELLFIYL
jgi:hypothetical protein